MSSVKIIGETADCVVHGFIEVGTTAVTGGSGIELTRGVQLYCPEANTGTVFAGNRPTLTAGAAASTSGFPIPADAGLFYPTSSLENLHLIADTVGQRVYFLAY